MSLPKEIEYLILERRNVISIKTQSYSYAAAQYGFQKHVWIYYQKFKRLEDLMRTWNEVSKQITIEMQLLIEKEIKQIKELIA